MFGFVVANPEALSEEQKKRYKGIYCGLCDALGRTGGMKCRMALTYDLAFLAAVLSSVNGRDFCENYGKCVLHPVKKHLFLENEFTSYAADMNIALAYYKYLDDWKDDKTEAARIKARLFRKNIIKIESAYPEVCDSVKRCLKELENTENEGVLIPDIPAGIFGRLLGSIFAGGSNAYKDELFLFGEALGKFIYITDAAVDLKSDIKRKRYNPLVRYSINDIKPVLEALMADCVEKYERLPVIQDKEIIENVLFSGVWTVFEMKMKGSRK